MQGNIKLKLDLTPEQHWMLGNGVFATQMFRNHCIAFLKQRYFQKRAWLRANQESIEYQDYLKHNTEYVQKLKAFKKKYPSKVEQDAHKSDLPVKPKRFHPLLESQSVALNQELTARLSQAKEWLWTNITRFHNHLEQQGFSIPKTSPKNICVFYNSLPLKVRKSLGALAKNEGVLLYLLAAPRSALVQVLQDLDKTFNQAFEKQNNHSQHISRKSGGASKGFPQFKKIKRCGSIRFQLDGRLTSYVTAWDKQIIQTPEFGELHWRDGGYALPDSPAKMMTIIKEHNGDVFAVFYGDVTYNAKRIQQKQRAVQRQPVVVASPTLEAFFQEQTVAIDLNRRSGQLQVVCHIPQDVPASLLQNTIQRQNVVHHDVQQNATDDADTSSALVKTMECGDVNAASLTHKQNSNRESMLVDAPVAKPNHFLSLFNPQQEFRLIKKQERRERYIKYQQRHLARQDLAKKKSKVKRNPNGLHINSKHSRRRQITQNKINKAHAKNVQHKEVHYRLLAQKLILGKRVVFAEHLNVAGMFSPQNHKNNKENTQYNKSKRKNNNRSQHKASFGLFMRILEEECIKNNVVLLQCDRYDPTSQFCHQCGHRWGRLDTSIRQITCPECRVEHDRDVNASINVQFLALYRYVQYLINKDNPNLQISTETNQNKTKQEKPLNNIEQLNIKNKIPWAESVHGEQAYTSLFQISHEALMNYIKGSYPIKRIIDTIEERHLRYQMNASKRLDKPLLVLSSCGNGYHSTFSKAKSSSQSTKDKHVGSANRKASKQ